MRTLHQASSGFKFHFSNLDSFPNWKMGQLKSQAGGGGIWLVLGTCLSLFAER